MSQFLLFVLLYALGCSACLASGLGHRPHLCGALGFVIGAVVMEIIVMALLVSGVGFTAAAALVAALCVLAGCLAVTYRRGGIEPGARRVLAGWSLGFVVLALVMTPANLTLMTYDSHYIVMYGGVIAHDGELRTDVLQQLGDYGVFQVLAQSLSVFTNKSFLWAFTPLFGVSTSIAFGILLTDALDALGARLRWRWIVVALVTVATFSVYMVFRHVFYIQTNFGTAAYLLVFCALFWTSEVDRDLARLPIAMLAIFALATHRIEGPLISLLFVALAVLPSRLPRRAILTPLALVSAGVCGWYVILGNAALPTSEFLTPSRAYLVASLLVGFTAYLGLSSIPMLRFLDHVHRRAPVIIAVLTLAALVVAFAVRPGHMTTSLRGWFLTLAFTPYWEGAWVAIVGLAIVGLFAPAPPARGVFVVGIVANMALILLLVLNRTPYYVGIGDSAARMAIHSVPLAFFYFGLKFMPLLAPVERQAQASS